MNTKSYNSMVKEIFGPGSLPATKTRQVSKEVKSKPTPPKPTSPVKKRSSYL